MRYLIIFLALSACATAHEPDLVASSTKYLGLHEVNDRQELSRLVGVDPVETEWCAAFINAVLKQNGYPTSDRPLIARGFVNYGAEVVGEPEPGDIIVLKRGSESWQGHVGFYLETVIKNGQPHYVIISGNDDNSVKINSFNANRVVAVRRPI